MDNFFYWFGIIHTAAYTVGAFSFASVLFINWAVDRFKLKADLIRAFHQIMKERRP